MLLKPATVHILSAFVDDGVGGNPAGVVLDAEKYSKQERQTIAAKVGLSETAFVSSSTVADYKLEFFTPTEQIPHCGHATIATFSFLAQKGLLKKTKSSKETVDGIRNIYLTDNLTFMEQTAPRYTVVGPQTPGVNTHLVMDSLFLNSANLPDNLFPIIANTGNNFLLIPLRNEETLAKIRPEFGSVERISKLLDLVGYYAFTTQGGGEHGDAVARMFGPAYGIPEESATGMAAGPLACYLHDVLGVKKQRYIIKQGQFMRPPSPSKIIVNLVVENEEITRLLVGGSATFLRAVTFG
ncbi:MAG: PhzF family phenazine biosynthesis protein [Bacteroidota bacterium]